MSLEFLAKMFSKKKPLDMPVQVDTVQNNHSTNRFLTQVTNQIKKHEGLVLHAYTDSLGLLTIGYGRLIDKAKNGGITEPEAEYLLANDINKVYDALTRYLPYFQTLTQPRQAVLLNMAFQMGTHGLMQFKNTLRLIENGDYSDAADNMLQSLWAQQTPNRANEMAEQMRSGQWQSG